MSVYITVRCPDCHSINIVRHGKSGEGKQRYGCQNVECPRRTFILDYTYNGCRQEVKKKIPEMITNGSGIKDTARVLKITTDTVISELKKKREKLENVNQSLIKTLKNPEIIVEVVKVGGKEKVMPNQAEVDEMQSFFGKKENQRWLWHAINHYTGEILAFVLGNRQDEVFRKLKELLKPFGITQYYTDGLKTYERELEQNEQEICKFKMQIIERNHLTLRTRVKRLQRKSICYSRSVQMHDIVIGLFINKYEFGLEI